jgi:hypothetical protein
MPAHPPHHELFDLSPESWWSVQRGRTRYAGAIAVAGLLFCTLGWPFAAPHPAMEGVSLLVWQHGLVGSLVLALLLLAATGICSLLIHPDSPHMGLFCALLGMACLSIKGGTIHMLAQYALDPTVHSPLPAITYRKLGLLLMIECVQWAFLFFIAEAFARFLHDRVFSNTRWITRHSPDLVVEVLRNRRVGVNPRGHGLLGEAHGLAKMLQTDKLTRTVAAPLALIVNAVLAMVLLKVFLQTEAKGQVLIGLFASFTISTVISYLMFSQAPLHAFLLALPVAAGVGYYWGSTVVPAYPGHVGFFMMRALPIDYFTAGMAGAIIGYYGGFRWLLNMEPDGQ